MRQKRVRITGCNAMLSVCSGVEPQTISVRGCEVNQERGPAQAPADLRTASHTRRTRTPYSSVPGAKQ